MQIAKKSKSSNLIFYLDGRKDEKFEITLLMFRCNVCVCSHDENVDDDTMEQ